MILDALLAKGDSVSIERGRLVIKPASGKPVPDWWLKQHERQLVAEIAGTVGVEALELVSHSVGVYGKSPGITLQFASLIHDGNRYAIFNVENRRARNTTTGKVGALLPAGQFRVGERSGFWKFWLRTGLPYQKRSNIYQRIGKLKDLVFSADLGVGERLDASTLKPLEVAADILATNWQPSDNQATTNRQPTDNQDSQPRKPLETECFRALQPNRTTGSLNYGKRQEVIRGCGNTGAVSFSSFPTPEPKRPEEQTVDEWLSDYSSAGAP